MEMPIEWGAIELLKRDSHNIEWKRRGGVRWGRHTYINYSSWAQGEGGFNQRVFVRSKKHLGIQFSEALIEFARSGEPDWHPYDTHQRNTQIFGTGAGLVSDPEATIRSLWH